MATNGQYNQKMFTGNDKSIRCKQNKNITRTEKDWRQMQKKKELLTERVMIRLTKSQSDKLNKEAFNRTLEEGGTISVSMIIRKALIQSRPDLFQTDEKIEIN